MATDADIAMEPVTSSQISAVGYDEPSKTLRIDFVSGATYDYDAVPLGIYQAVRDATSVGGTFNDLVKRGGFAYRRIA